MKSIKMTFFIFMMLCVSSISAQDGCSAFVTDALANVDTLCEATGRNELCYGNNIVSVTTVTGDELNFSQPGDIVAISDIDSIRTNPYAEPDEWGIALMRLQANIPDSLPGQNVTFLLFGDASLTNADSETAMQAVYFSSGIGEATCNEIPEDGLLIQSPDYELPVEFVINDVEIKIGSTIYLQAEADNEMTIYVVEGFAFVTSDGETVNIAQGTMTSIKIDKDLHAVGIPEKAKAYKTESLLKVPIGLLEHKIEIAQPANEDDIDAANQGIVGTWVGTDIDGSSIRFAIIPLGANRYYFAYHDDSAGPCRTVGTNEFMGGGVGVLQDNVFTVDPVLKCTGTTVVWHDRTLEYTYHPESDTLSEVWGGTPTMSLERG